jgi:hypothetical protein
MARRRRKYPKRRVRHTHQRRSKATQVRVNRLYRQADGTLVRETRFLRKDELLDIRKDAAPRMAALRQRWEKYKDAQALLGAFVFCAAQLPQWLFVALFDLLTAQFSRIPRDWVRWNLVLALRDVSRLKWKDVFSETAKLLDGTYAAGSPETIRKSYERIERELPREQRRPRTHRRQPPR